MGKDEGAKTPIQVGGIENLLLSCSLLFTPVRINRKAKLLNAFLAQLLIDQA